MTNDNQYILKINPNYKTDRYLKNNKIDARFIDKSTGRFIDITCIYPWNNNMYRDKSQHSYIKSDLFPLYQTKFLGASTFVPNNVINVLIGEYSLQVMRPKFGTYIFEELKVIGKILNNNNNNNHNNNSSNSNEIHSMIGQGQSNQGNKAGQWIKA